MKTLNHQLKMSVIFLNNKMRQESCSIIISHIMYTIKLMNLCYILINFIYLIIFIMLHFSTNLKSDINSIFCSYIRQ